MHACTLAQQEAQKESIQCCCCYYLYSYTSWCSETPVTAFFHFAHFTEKQKCGGGEFQNTYCIFSLKSGKEISLFCTEENIYLIICLFSLPCFLCKDKLSQGLHIFLLQCYASPPPLFLQVMKTSSGKSQFPVPPDSTRWDSLRSTKLWVLYKL